MNERETILSALQRALRDPGGRLPLTGKFVGSAFEYAGGIKIMRGGYGNWQQVGTLVRLPEGAESIIRAYRPQLALPHVEGRGAVRQRLQAARTRITAENEAMLTQLSDVIDPVINELLAQFEALADPVVDEVPVLV
ncbi:MAG: hypothetical protein H6619_06260 [Deltaproteobacteria bacterium]|nr:hypothetical protein [Deltaproteobacteria bacterium]